MRKIARSIVAIVLFFVVTNVWYALDTMKGPLLPKTTRFFLPQKVAPSSSSVIRQHKLLVEITLPDGLEETASVQEYDEYTRAKLTGASEAGREAAQRGDRCEDSNTRTFATSSRKDYSGFASQELVELGLCRARHPEKRGVDFYVGEQFVDESADMRHFSPYFNEGAAIGSMPGLMRVFGSKDAYSVIWWRCDELKLENHPKSVLCSDYLLPSFNVNGEERKSQAAFRKGEIYRDDVPQFDRLFQLLGGENVTTSWWIVKPQRNTYESRGMHLSKLAKRHVRTKSKFEKWIKKHTIDSTCADHYDRIRCDRRKMTFQYYVHNPLLVHRRKFDLRLSLVITSLDPLRVYVLRHAYPKIASKDFDMDDTGDQCRHIRMLMDPECETKPEHYVRNLGSRYPKSTASPFFFDALEATDWTSSEAWWSSQVWPAVELAFSQILMLVRPTLLRLETIAATKEKEIFKQHRRYGLLSPDILVDSNGRVYIEEINTNGAIVGTHLRNGGLKDLFHDDGYLRELFALLGANGYPDKSKYGQKLEQAIDQVCRGEPGGACSAEQREMLGVAVHEEAHAGAHWYRLYPPIRCFASSSSEKEGDCVVEKEEDGSKKSWWPEQARISGAMRDAMEETPNDVLLNRFLDDVDTSKIHGVLQVPGHGRYLPRTLRQH